MLRAKVNDKDQFEIVIKDNHIKINDREIAADFQKQSDGSMNLLIGNKSHNVRLVSANEEEKSYRLKVNGNDYVVAISDEMDQLLAKLGFSAHASKKMNEVKAPMPGLVLKVVVAPGQEVKKGEALLVLEAMKMENVIKSPGEGKVKAIKVKAQDKVDKNTVLIEFE